MEDYDVLYRHTQIGYVMSVLLVGSVLVYGWVIWTRQGAPWVNGPILVVMVGAALTFSSLTTEVSEERFTFYFGPGVWRTEVPIDAIRRVEVVRNSPYSGWGIRWTHHGWLYNVGGLDAVEITAADHGTFRVGTDEPEALHRALVTAQRDPKHDTLDVPRACAR